MQSSNDAKSLIFNEITMEVTMTILIALMVRLAFHCLCKFVWVSLHPRHYQRSITLEATIQVAAVPFSMFSGKLTLFPA